MIFGKHKAGIFIISADLSFQEDYRIVHIVYPAFSLTDTEEKITTTKQHHKQKKKKEEKVKPISMLPLVIINVAKFQIYSCYVRTDLLIPCCHQHFQLINVVILRPHICLSICYRNIISWLMLVQMFVISSRVFVPLPATPW